MTKFSKAELGINTEENYHQQYGLQSVRMIYNMGDFSDYAIMSFFTFMTARLSYGTDHGLTHLTQLLCIYMIGAFYYRHGAKLQIPHIMRHPAEVLYSAYHKISNINLPTAISALTMLIENQFVNFTPMLKDYHYSNSIKNIAVDSVYLHLGLITAYRSIVLIDHIIKRKLVKEILKDSAWNKVFNKRNNPLFEILHAYLTGIQAHLLSIAPWYFAAITSNRSLLAAPITLVAEIWLLLPYRLLSVNSWYYRDHWLSHHSAFDFVYLHGPHHDAIPSGLLAVDESGFLESFLKSALGYSCAYMNPFHAMKIFTKSIYMNINNHQYIPGVFPYARDNITNGQHHAQHHYLNLKPLGIAFGNLDIPAISVEFDQQINGFNPETATWNWFKSTTNQHEPLNPFAKKFKNDGGNLLQIQFFSICMLALAEISDFDDGEKRVIRAGIITLAILAFLYSTITTQQRIHWNFFKSEIKPVAVSDSKNLVYNKENILLSQHHGPG